MTVEYEEQGLAGSVPQDLAGHGTRVPAVSRRTVLRGASAALPTILTLGSGSALANSSNLISTNGPGTGGANGEVLCLDPQSTHGPTYQDPDRYDLGSPPYGEVTSLPTDADYRAKVDGKYTDLTPEEVCLQGGEIEYKLAQGGQNRVLMKPGALVSAAAVNSFGNRIITTDLTTL